MRYKNILFDLYGTLVDIHTDEENAELWKKMSRLFETCGAEDTPEGWRSSFETLQREAQETSEEIRMEHIFSGMFAQKGILTDTKQIGQTCRQFRAWSTEYLCLYPGAKEFLQALRKQGRKLYLLTNAQRAFTWQELDKLEIAACFDDIFISSDYGIKKPNPRFFALPLEKYKLQRQACLMIGNDEICDIGGASSAGIDSIYLHTNLSPEYTGKYKATQMVMEPPERMEQLLDVIKEAEFA